MNLLNIRHRTTYRYREPVQLAPHRFMLRPREGHDLRLLSGKLDVAPAATLSWTNDIFGNAVATAQFAQATDRLVIESLAVVELAAAPWPVFDIAASAVRYPFEYSQDERIDLAALAESHYPDSSNWLAQWARGFVRGQETDTLALLKDLATGVFEQISYQSREEEGTQSPLQTLERGWGSCRDLAVLFIEAARSLGFGARVISGYLYNPDRPATGAGDAGSTHAWAEIFLPGAGWISFDPTNRGVGGFNLIPVAVGRIIDQVMPISGAFQGATDAFQGMSVEVQITP
ncbi:MAG: transglutaminase family protein [Pseudomonadota bacterium]